MSRSRFHAFKSIIPRMTADLLARRRDPTPAGDLGQQPGHAEVAAKQGVEALDQEVPNLSESWQFDDKSYLQSGANSYEQIERGHKAGLRIAELDNRLYYYPALIRVMPRDRRC